MPYNGGTSIFLKVLLNKKYALPFRLIDQLVVHFLIFKQEKRALPVLWHQSLLVFAQRYKGSCTTKQREQLRALLKVQFHHQITPEIRKELFSVPARDDVASKGDRMEEE